MVFPNGNPMLKATVGQPKINLEKRPKTLLVVLKTAKGSVVHVAEAFRF